ncbi:MAG TPA: hypothetical protein VEK08_13925 [Planctomycetota bacterium]|nr:hypothetical protein [Planctomycetota bacterium]
MRQWLAADSARRLITVFHELYASGPIYGSAFWLSPIQKHICKSLFALSTHALTTTAIYRDKLSKWGHSEKITAMPVISNVGESDAPPALSERERKLIVFGSRPTRLRAYSLSRTAIDQACRILAIDEIWDIGAPLPQELTHGLSVPCRVLGPLPADRIHLLMQRALAGFIHYKPGYWAKSGIFAAYCAHGMLPVTALPARPDLEGYASDQLSCVIDGESRSICAERAQGIAAAAYAWYRGHDIESSAGRIAGLIANGTHERILASGGAWR